MEPTNTKVISHPWKQWEDDKLTTMLNNGNSAKEIANELGRTRNSVIGRTHRLNIKRAPQPSPTPPGQDRGPRPVTLPKFQRLGMLRRFGQ